MIVTRDQFYYVLTFVLFGLVLHILLLIITTIMKTSQRRKNVQILDKAFEERGLRGILEQSQVSDKAKILFLRDNAQTLPQSSSAQEDWLRAITFLQND